MLRVELKEIIAKYGDVVLSPMVISLNYCCWAKIIMVAKDWNGSRKLNGVGHVLFLDYEEKKCKTEDCENIVIVDRNK
jgi:hypothetical protein